MPRSRANLKVIRPAPRSTPPARARAAKAAASKADVDSTDGSDHRGSTQRIVESITSAIVERRLMPGTKLAEQKIADIFQVSRTIVRQALNQLSRDHLVTLEPARGAFVATPSVEEARQVFEVRTMIEAALVKQLAARITDAQVAELRAHLAQEREAVARTDVPGRTRLLADFHVVLARMLGNDVLAHLLNDLLSRSSLISLMYQSSHSAEHSQDEHEQIVDALARRDVRAAVKLMEQHIQSVERNLQLDPRTPDLESVLRPATA
jgi:DNA-binding GntR family transcriptional regulator